MNTKNSRGVRKGLLELRLKNFKSVKAAEIDLDPLTIFVGPNASGKSNILNSLRFLKRALQEQLMAAVNAEGGIQSVRHKVSGRGRPPKVGMSVRFGLEINKELAVVEYGFELKARRDAEFEVNRERCVVWAGHGVSRSILAQFDRQGSELKMPEKFPVPRLASHRLALPLLTGIENFARVFDALTSVQVYAISPAIIREPQDPDAGDRLESDAHNLASVLADMKIRRKKTYSRLMEYLTNAVPGNPHINPKRQGNKLGLELVQQVAEHKTLAFDAYEMSDGTLRLLAILTAIHQRSSPLAIAIEEPEATIHPGALGVLLDALRANQERTQILISTHSTDVLDRKDIRARSIRLVQWQNGVTRVAEMGRASRESVEEGLMTAGELLRANALRTDSLASVSEPSVTLFPEL